MRVKYTIAAIFSLLLTIIAFIPSNAQYNKELFFRRGRQFLIDNKFPQAIENFNTLIKSDTTLYEAYFFRGIAKYNLGDLIGAQDDFSQALKKNPVYTQAYHYRAVTYSRLNKYNEALEDLQNAVDLRPEYAGLYFTRGITYFMSQQFDKAIENFNKFISYDSQVPDVYINRGTAWLFLKDTTNALNDYNKAISLNSFDPEGYIRRSRIYTAKEENDKALADLNQAISLDTTNAFSYFNRALVRYNSKNINGALTDLDKVIELDPENSLTYYNRALIRSQIGDYNRALEDYNKVAEINPNNVLVYYNRAALYLEIGNLYKAIDDYSKAIELYPDFANAYINRSYIKNQLGQYKQAKQDYDFAQSKISEYRSKMTDSTFSAFADTSKHFGKLLALDADFSKQNFTQDKVKDKMMDITIKPLYRVMAGAPGNSLALDRQYFNPMVEELKKRKESFAVDISNKEHTLTSTQLLSLDSLLNEQIKVNPTADVYFQKAIIQGQLKQFTSSLNYYAKAIELDPKNPFLYLNRSTVNSEMVDFISSIDNTTQTVVIDNTGSGRTKTKMDMRIYNYDDAIRDLNKAIKLAPDFAYAYYNRGNLKCLSGSMPEAIDDYSAAIKQYPYMGEAYFNRGLVQIYLKDTNKGCLDISKAGELGVSEAYAIIKKYCTKTEE